MSIRAGIRGKIALLVVVATALCASIVAWIVSDRASALLRDHEVVDLGDEAQLRGWEIIDSINGLHEDARSILHNGKFLMALENGDAPAGARSAQESSTRAWQRYLRVDIVSMDADGNITGRVPLRQNAAEIPPWIPTAETQGGTSGDVMVSPITRLEVDILAAPAGALPIAHPGKRSVAGVWAYAPLPPTAGAEAGRRFLSILLWLPEGLSARHLFALADANGDFLVRPKESAAPGEGNEYAFLKEFSTASEGSPVSRLLKGTPTAQGVDSPQVERIEKRERVSLVNPPYFQEGVPDKDLAAKIEADSETDRQNFGLELTTSLAPLGRISGLSKNTQRELRLFAWSAEEMRNLRTELEKSLKARYGSAAVDWQAPTVCPTATVWATRIEAKSLGLPVPYLLMYAVLDDELAYGINGEISTLWKIALALAAVFGAIAFAISIFFTRPLQRMTAMSKAVVASEPGRLLENLQEISGKLPVHRRDEVGDIARSSQVLFGAVIDSHKELDRRVQARTEKLNAAKLELQEVNERLESLNRDKDLFVAKISHNLRQPLNAIYLEVETFLTLYDPNEEQEECLKNIQGHADRQQEMVSEILAYQKIIMGSEKLNKQSIPAAAFVRNLAEAHRPTAHANGNTLVTKVADDLGDLEADQLALTKVLDNLMTNACKFTRNGTVTIAADRRQIDGEQWIEFSVEDEGEGMSAEEQSKAFTPFVYRKAGNAGGNGLGLVICKELTEQMGGRIGFVSEVGKGTRFTVLLPVIARGDRYAGPDDAETPVLTDIREITQEPDLPGANHPGGTILIIDDDDSARELLAGLLRNQGYDVITAATGKEGLDMASKLRPQVITLDIVMPDMDGWEVLTALKSDPTTAAIPVIMVSVMADRNRGLALGVADVLVKPVDTKQLNRVVQRAVGHVAHRDILVVDDDAASRKRLCGLMRNDGWQTIEASDGKEALEILERTLPAAIVLDLVMPVMDGFDFLTEIEKRASARSIPILVVTGKTTTREETEFLRQRVEDIILKGGNTAQSVLERIHSILTKN